MSKKSSEIRQARKARIVAALVARDGTGCSACGGEIYWDSGPNDPWAVAIIGGPLDGLGCRRFADLDELRMVHRRCVPQPDPALKKCPVTGKARYVSSTEATQVLEKLLRQWVRQPRRSYRRREIRVYQCEHVACDGGWHLTSAPRREAA